MRDIVANGFGNLFSAIFGPNSSEKVTTVSRMPCQENGL